MAHRLDKKETASAGIHRIICEELESAHSHLTLDKGAPTAEAIHETRKALKRLRSVLYLVRPIMPPPIYNREWARFRDCGKALAEMRDTHVMWMTYRRLVCDSGEKLGRAKRGREDAIDILRREAGRRSRDMTSWRPLPLTLVEARNRLADWSLESMEWRILRDRMRKNYRAGMHWMEKLGAGTTDPREFHEWRKSAKHLYHHLGLLEPMRPIPMCAFLQRVDNLANELGREHDLAVLQTRLNTLRRQGHKVDATIARLLDRQRRGSQKAALGIGGHVYDAKPKAFAAKLDKHWRKWREAE